MVYGLLGPQNQFGWNSLLTHHDFHWQYNIKNQVKNYDKPCSFSKFFFRECEWVHQGWKVDSLQWFPDQIYRYAKNRFSPSQKRGSNIISLLLINMGAWFLDMICFSSDRLKNKQLFKFLLLSTSLPKIWESLNFDRISFSLVYHIESTSNPKLLAEFERFSSILNQINNFSLQEEKM